MTFSADGGNLLARRRRPAAPCVQAGRWVRSSTALGFNSAGRLAIRLEHDRRHSGSSDVAERVEDLAPECRPSSANRPRRGCLRSASGSTPWTLRVTRSPRRPESSAPHRVAESSDRPSPVVERDLDASLPSSLGRRSTPAGTVQSIAMRTVQDRVDSVSDLAQLAAQTLPRAAPAGSGRGIARPARRWLRGIVVVRKQSTSSAAIDLGIGLRDWPAVARSLAVASGLNPGLSALGSLEPPGDVGLAIFEQGMQVLPDDLRNQRIVDS